MSHSVVPPFVASQLLSHTDIVCRYDYVWALAAIALRSVAVSAPIFLLLRFRFRRVLRVLMPALLLGVMAVMGYYGVSAYNAFLSPSSARPDAVRVSRSYADYTAECGLNAQVRPRIPQEVQSWRS